MLAPRTSISLAVALLLTATRAWGADAAPPTGLTERATLARTAFNQGTAYVKDARWGEAFSSFERADAIAPHAITTYNLGACARALGFYTRARGYFLRALEQQRASGDKELPPTLVAETTAALEEIAGMLARATIAYSPVDATIAVDGRPLEKVERAAAPPLTVAGVRPPGNPEPPPAAKFEVLLDPGTHVFVFSRKGYANAVTKRPFQAGESAVLTFALDRLPATLHVDSERKGALVHIDGNDVGPTPAEVLRAAGGHRVTVEAPGFVRYETTVQLSPGEETRLNATLPPEKPSLFTRWWFWTAAGVVVAGAAVATYELTRPAPQRPEVGSGTLGWSVAVP